MSPNPTPPTAPQGADPAVLQAFDALAERLARPKAWIQGTYARNTLGIAAGASDSDAACWCLTGALVLISQPEYSVVRHHLTQAVRPFVTLVSWNDALGRKHADVLALIAAARAAYLAIDDPACDCDLAEVVIVAREAQS